MNIDDCIEVQQKHKEGKDIVMRECNLQVPTNWYPKDRESLFNFITFEYRLAPDVVYKILHDDFASYATAKPEFTECEYITGYWVEGEQS